MATITTKNAHNLPSPGFSGVPYGNTTQLKYTLETSATGAVVNSSSTAAVAISDEVILGVVPAGTEVFDAMAIISDAFTAATTFDLGLKEKAAGFADAQDDADYFFAAQSSAALVVARKATPTAPIVLKRDMYLVLTAKGAAHASPGIATFVISGVSKGI